MDWDRYWLKAAERQRKGLYQAGAEFYRNQILSRSAARVLSRYLNDSPGCHYLHAGCGSGGSDGRISLSQCRIHCLDLSPVALDLYRKRSLRFHPWAVCGNLFRLPYASQTLDGLFNFGVMEHFTEPEIGKILAEFRRVLKPKGWLILFWPPEFGLSVLAFKIFLGAIARFRKTPLELFPEEVSRIRSFRWAGELMERHRFEVMKLQFGWRDLFTHVVVIARKP